MIDPSERLKALLQRHLEVSTEWQDGELSANREDAYAYYKAEAPAPSEAFVSEAVSTDVADTIEWILPSILKPLIESPDVVRFDPVNPEDQDQADVESDYVHHTFMKRCNGFLKLYVHIKDALMLKNAVFWTHWSDRTTHQKETYSNLTEVELADLLTPADGSEIRVLEQTQREVPALDPLTLNPVPGVPPQPVFDVTVRRVQRDGQPRVENCIPENFVVHSQHASLDLSEVPFCAYKVCQTRAELMSLGYDPKLIDELPLADGSIYNDAVKDAREDVERFAEGLTEELQQYDVWYCYLRADLDEDGLEEQISAVVGGDSFDVLLGWDEVPECPFTSSTPFVAAHKFYGYSVYDKLKALTDQKTRVLRMLEDNLDRQNNPIKKAVRGASVLDDLLDNRRSLWRVDDLTAVDVVQSPLIDQTAQYLLGQYDRQRSERTGMDPNAQSITSVMPEESMNTAVERILTLKEEVVGMMIRVFAETGVKGALLKIRNLMLRHMPREEMVKLRNKWTTVNPGNWIERDNTTVLVGLGTGDRYKKQQALMSIFQMQQQMMEMDMEGILISPERLNWTVSELIRASGLGDPDDFVLNPSSLEKENPQNPSPRARETMRALQMRQQRQQQMAQMEQQKQQAAAEAQQQIAQLTIQMEQIRAEAKTQAAATQATTADKDRWAEMAQFMEENRRAWAELGQQLQESQAQRSADMATQFIENGMKQEIEEDKARREKESGDE